MASPESPTLLIDSREQTPLFIAQPFRDQFRSLKSSEGKKSVPIPEDWIHDATMPIEKATLYTGDYSLKGAENLFAVERKSLSDLVGSITNDRVRFEKECLRLRGLRFKRVFVIGTEQDIKDGNYRSRATPASVWGSMRHFEVRYDLPFIFCKDEREACQRLSEWTLVFWRECRKIGEKVL